MSFSYLSTKLSKDCYVNSFISKTNIRERDLIPYSIDYFKILVQGNIIYFKNPLQGRLGDSLTNYVPTEHRI